MRFPLLLRVLTRSASGATNMHAQPLKLTTAGLISFLALYYGAAFSARQAAALSLFGLALYKFLYEPLKRARWIDEKFLPYWVVVRPKWDELLFDYGLVRTIEELRAIYAQAANTPSSQYNLVRDNITFTVVRPDIIFHNKGNYFSRDVDLWLPIEEVKLPPEIGDTRAQEMQLTHSPYICVRSRVNGIEIALAKRPSDSTGKVSAVLPHAEFAVYLTKSETNSGRLAKLDKARDDLIKQAGWTRKERVIDIAPEMLEHKYFEVEHKPI